MSSTETPPASAWPSNPWLEGHYAPVADELDAPNLEVQGSLPDGLRGAFLRNGPNPQFPPLGRYHLFDGDGMIHSVVFDGSGSAAYANRWIRNDGLDAERAAGRALFGGLAEFRLPPPDVMAVAGPMKNTANTHVVAHAGHILALMEGAGPIEVAPDLDTIGPFDFGGRLRGAMTAHPKADPTTGELVFFGYSPVPPFLRVHTADRNGDLTWTTEVELPGPVMMHDFAVTATHVVIFDLPAVFDLQAMLAGGTSIYWEPDRGARVGVLRRGEPGTSIRWIDTDPFWVFHFLNAYDEPDGSITVTGCRAPRLNTSFGDDATIDGLQPMLYRWRIDAAAGSLGGQQLDDAPTDFPRINDAHSGLPHRYGYSGHTRMWSGDEAMFDGVVKHDLAAGTSRFHLYGDSAACGETVFAPDPNGTGEDAGWLLNFVHDLASDESSVVVLDAPTLEEVARVVLPRRVPFGFHGSFVAAR